MAQKTEQITARKRLLMVARRICKGYRIPESYVLDVAQEIMASPYEAMKKGLKKDLILRARLMELSRLFNNDINIDDVIENLQAVEDYSPEEELNSLHTKVRNLIYLYLRGYSVRDACQMAGIVIEDRSQEKRLKYHLQKFCSLQG